MRIKINKRILLLVVLLGAIGGLVYGIWQTVTWQRKYVGNLLHNSNFEIVDRSGKLQSWTEDTRGGWSVNTEGSYEGKRCMQATVGWSWLSQDVRVKPERHYLLKAYVRSNITIPGEIKGEDTFLTLEYLDGKGSLIERDHEIVSAASSWEEKIRQIYTPKGTKKVRVKLAKREGEGSVWFDRLELKQVPSSSILNPNFELLDKLERPKYWKEGPQGGWSSTTEDPFEGERCMQATVSWSWLNQEIPVESEKYYVLKVCVRSDITIPGKINYENTFLVVEHLGEGAKIIKEDLGMVNATFFWQQKILQIYTPKGTKKVRVKLAKRQGEGSVWFDGLELEKFSPPMLYNSSFEMVDQLGRVDYWREDPKGGWSSTTEDPFEGERCMQATVSWSWLSQDVYVRPERYYLLKVYLRSDIIIPGVSDYENTLLYLECLDKENQVIESDYRVFNATPSWRQKSRQIYTPENTKKMRIRIAKRQGEGSVWFDKLELKEVSPSLPDKLRIDNPSFEVADQLNRADSWKQDPKGGWSVSTEEPYEGERCVQATVSWSWLSQEISAKAERYYTLKGYLRSDIAPSEKKDSWNAFLALECLDGKHKVIAEQTSQFKATSLWKPQEVSIYAPENTDEIKVKLAKRQGEGSVWFDNLKMTELAWYMKIKFLRRILEDKPFFIFYFSIYFILLISLLRLILKR